jgi:hypothetical protein
MIKEAYITRIHYKDKDENKWLVFQEHRPNGRGGIRIPIVNKKFKTKAEAIEYRNKYIKPKLRKINLESGKHRCRVCNKVKPIDQFKKDKKNISHGIESICKECHNNKSMENYNSVEQSKIYYQKQQSLNGCGKITQIMTRINGRDKEKRKESERKLMNTNPFYRAEKLLGNAMRRIANDCAKMEGCTEILTQQNTKNIQFKETIRSSYVLVGRLYKEESPTKFRLNLKITIGKNSRGQRVFKFNNYQTLTFDTVTWLNYKNRKELYELDHIIPRDYWTNRINTSKNFNEALELLIMGCNYRNIQILINYENQIKSNKIDARRLNNYLNWWKRNNNLMDKYKDEFLEKCQDERQNWLLSLVNTLEYGINMHPRQVEIGNG